MTTRYFGQPIKRNEDPRLLTGQALFVDDVHLPGMLHVAVLRSDLAHARIYSIDLSAARARPGVLAVYTADDLGDYWKPGPLLVPPPPIANIEFHQRTQVPLAKGKVRHAGEALVMVVAESRYVAEDARTYTDGPLLTQSPVSYEWNHGLGETIDALLQAGLRLDFVHEHREVPWQALPWMVPGPDPRTWVLPEHAERVPLAYSLRASKPA